MDGEQRLMAVIAVVIGFGAVAFLGLILHFAVTEARSNNEVKKAAIEAGCEVPT